MVDTKKLNPWGDTPEEAEVSSSSSGGERKDIEHFKPKVGDNTVRIIGTYKWFHEYWIPKVKRTVIAGPLKDCPIHNNPNRQKQLDEAKELREAGKEEEAKALYRKTFSTYDPKVRYAVNVLDRSDGKIKIWKFSRTMKENIMSIAEKFGDPNNYDLIVTRKGTKLETKYTVMPAPTSEELTEEEKSLKTFNLAQIFKATDLSKVKSYLKGEIPKKSQKASATKAEEDHALGDAEELSEEDLKELNDIGDVI